MENLISHVQGTRKFNIAMLTTKSALPILNQNSMQPKFKGYQYGRDQADSEMYAKSKAAPEEQTKSLHPSSGRWEEDREPLSVKSVCSTRVHTVRDSTRREHETAKCIEPSTASTCHHPQTESKQDLNLPGKVSFPTDKEEVDGSLPHFFCGIFYSF